jgi:rod shape-determining protein MreB
MSRSFLKNNMLINIRKIIKKYWQRFMSLFSDDIGIDLGTANTLVYVKGRGIVLNEPSIVALNKKTGQVVAVGEDAKKMLGRTPAHIEALQPLMSGVISDFEITEEMLGYFIRKAQESNTKLMGPRVVVGVPSGITTVEIRAVQDAAKNAGAREVYIVEEPFAAAVGIQLPVHDPSGSMVVDIGGGTSDVGVISLGGLVSSRNVLIAGDVFDDDIINYIRSEFKILIGKKSAEDLKIAVAAVLETHDKLETTVRGRDLVSGLPREVIITDTDIREAINQSIDRLVDSIKEVLETTPPEVISDVMKQGIYLAGGGALIRGLGELLSTELGVPVYVADEPLTAVVRGTGKILEDIDAFSEALITHSHELSPTE